MTTEKKVFSPFDRAEYRPLTYLACPYSHSDPNIRASRAALADRVTVQLIKEHNWTVFSPISHSHPLALAGLKGDWGFWQNQDIQYIRLSERVVVLMLPGWKESVGVQAELEIARQMGIPVIFIDASNVADVAITDNTTNPKDLLGVTKPQLDLVPSALLLRVAKVMELGARKYGPYNWRSKKVRHTVYLAAAMRHLLQVLDGENEDPESGQSHAAHVAACMSILLDAEATGNLIDDRPTPGPASKLITQLAEKK